MGSSRVLRDFNGIMGGGEYKQLIFLVWAAAAEFQILQTKVLMAPTLEDLFEFMKNDKEERAKERERDKQEIKELISEGVKQEVRSLIQPIQERVKSLETVKDEVLDKLKVMSDQIKDIKEHAQERKDDTQPVTYASALQSTSLPNTPSDPSPAPKNLVK